MAITHNHSETSVLSSISGARSSLKHSADEVMRPLKRRVTISAHSATTSNSFRSSSSTSSNFPHIQEDDEYFNDHEQDDNLDHVIMAIDGIGNKKIGCAYYVAREQRLHCVEDIEGDGQEAVENLKLDIQPTILLMSHRIQNTNLCNNEQPRQASLVTDDNNQRPLPYELIIRPAADFKYENGLNKLVGVQAEAQNDGIHFMVPGEETEFDETRPMEEFGLTNHTGKLLYVAGCLNLESKVSIGCAGAVISHLHRRRASEYLQDDPLSKRAYRIVGMEMHALGNTMLVNGDTLTSLQIIQPESHPDSAKQGPGSSGAKESLSIYGLFYRFAKTPQGKNKLRQLFLRPSLDSVLIETRHKFLSVFTSSRNQQASERLSKSLSKIRNMRATVVDLQKGIDNRSRSLRSGVWAALLEFCFHTIDISETLNEIDGAERLPLCIKMVECLDKVQLQRIGKMIHDVVDLDQSVEERRTVINRNVSEDLDKIKDVYDGMDEQLWQEAQQITNKMPPDIDISLNVMFLPQLGFHIVVPLEQGRPVYIGEGWQKAFTTEKQAYFKDVRMKELDLQLGDLYAAICDAEIEIAYDLAQRVLRDEKLLVTGSDLCGELDCLLALSHGAIQHKLVRPKIVGENVIEIRGGRHILQEMTVPSFVPNNTTMDSSMMVLTGPNFSGKSVYLKQVALIVYMAQVGSFVPAETATVGLVDKMLTRITTRETVSKIQSAFMIDLQQITSALTSCTSRSLIVIDEFGKGTDNCDGAGLAAAVLTYLLEMKNPPRTLASTHFHEIFEDGRFDQYQNLAFAHMEVRLGRFDEEVAYLYNLRNGRSSLSYGHQCAVINGVPKAVIDRATQLSKLSLQGEDLVAACASLPAAELEELEKAEVIARAFIGTDLDVDVRVMLKAI